MTTRLKYWSVRISIIMVISSFAYVGGELSSRAAATSETVFCENDVCLKLYLIGYCLDAPGSNKGCNMDGTHCSTYRCSSGGGPGDGKVPILR